MIGVLEAERIMILESQVKHYERLTRELRKTLRDEIAMSASDADVLAQAELMRRKLFSDGIGLLPANWRVTARYMHADAMMEARNES